jgi:hypothetical protein
MDIPAARHNRGVEFGLAVPENNGRRSIPVPFFALSLIIMISKPLPLIFLLLLPSAVTAAAPDSTPPRPNVLFVAVDDLRPEFGCCGTEGIRSTSIDALAARGTVFDREVQV